MNHFVDEHSYCGVSDSWDIFLTVTVQTDVMDSPSWGPSSSYDVDDFWPTSSPSIWDSPLTRDDDYVDDGFWATSSPTSSPISLPTGDVPTAGHGGWALFFVFLPIPIVALFFHLSASCHDNDDELSSSDEDDDDAQRGQRKQRRRSGNSHNSIHAVHHQPTNDTTSCITNNAVDVEATPAQVVDVPMVKAVVIETPLAQEAIVDLSLPTAAAAAPVSDPE